MKRVERKGVVHFFNRTACRTLCGKSMAVAVCDLFGAEQSQEVQETSKPVTCPECARLYQEIKCAPWNEVDYATLDKAIYDAAKTDEQLKQGENDESEVG